MGTKVIYRADTVILGGSAGALEEAFDRADRGERVAMIVRDTFLCTDICAGNRYRLTGTQKERLPKTLFLGNGCLHPDRFKRYLEEQCHKMGIRLFYFMWYVDCTEREGGLLVRAAAKGGLFGVACREAVDMREETEDLSYQAYVKSGDEEEWDLLCVENAGKEGYSPEENLFLCKKALLEEFALRRQKDPKMSLGRFALRGYGKPAADRRRENGAALPPLPVPKTREGVYDVVVAGGGTSGVMAAIYAARCGAKTALIEPNYELGGTGTVGGVNTYWFGRRFRDVEEVDAEIARIYGQCRLERKPGIWSAHDDFHAGVRGYVYLKLCRQAGVELHLGELAYETHMEGDRIVSVTTMGDRGRRIYRGKIILDATGDGDIAVLAGADSVYGNERDFVTYWASLAQYVSPGRYKNNFSCMVCAFDPVNYTDFILQGRKLGEDMFDHGTYVSMRESRHIKGKTCVTLRDLLCYGTYEDGLYTCFSNYDPKGKVTADIVYGGMLPQQTHIQIPLSALMPVRPTGERILGLYVLGKAVSATHNVFPSIRMQPDLMHQGAVMGLLAAESIKRGTDPEGLSHRERRAMVEDATGDALFAPPKRETVRDMVYRIGKESRTHWVDVPFGYEEEGRSEMAEVLCAAPKECLPVISERLLTEQNREVRKRLIACGLWHGEDRWTKELCRMLCGELEEAGDAALPEREGSVSCVQLLPDHGVMPETVYGLNLLAWSREKCILEPFGLVLEKLKRQARDYRDLRKGTYHYVEAFAYVAERTGFGEFAPMLEELLGFGELRDPDGQDPLLADRLWILVLILNRALARLGSLSGYEGLVALLGQGRTAIRLSAVQELEALTGQRHGDDGAAWNRAVHMYPEGMAVQTVKERYW